MRRRIWSGLIGGVVYLALGWAGGIWLGLGFGLIFLLALYEFWRLNLSHGQRMRLLPPAVAGLALLGAATLAAEEGHAAGYDPGGFFAACVVGSFLAAAVLETAGGQCKGAGSSAALSVFAGVYTAFPPAYMILLRGRPGGKGLYYFLLLTAAVWANDTAAYFAGSAWGRRKLAPAISPGKTWEGAAAGLAGAGLAGLGMAAAFGREPWSALMLGVFLGLCGQLGDLFESMLKRDFGVKDSGSFLPGHGGVLDRFDSLFFAAPLLYYLLLVLGRL